MVEGDKMVVELLQSKYQIEALYLTEDFVTTFAKNGVVPDHAFIINHGELKKISQLQTPQNSLAVCRIPGVPKLPNTLNESLSLYLDGIRDPGNMGTIIRLCDWFGINDLFCSLDTVDVYNPKVIQASMGSFARVNVYPTEFDAVKTLAQKSGAVVYGAYMHGANVYAETLPAKSILVMGNEGKGIRDSLDPFIDQKISIPRFSTGSSGAESLNVSVATAVFCSEFKRR